jgi:hypothetical protein
MPLIRQSVQTARNTPSISSSGYEIAPVVADFVVPTGLAVTDVIDMCVLPAGYVPFSVKLITDDLDSNGSPTIALDVGIMTGTPGSLDTARTCGNEALTASTIGRTGGVAVEANAAILQLAPTDADRSFGVRIATGAATLTVGARIRLNVEVRPSLYGV